MQRRTGPAVVSTSGGHLQLTGVGTTFGNVTALRNIDLDVAPGTFLTLLGASGSGKSTTLNAITGFVPPDRGSVTLDGRDITSVPPHRREIGMVFQNYALFPHMNVTDNVAFPLEVRGVPKAERRRRAAEVLERVHLDGYGSRRPHELSGGQQQRVALARAIAFEPRLLLMDEPMGALDKNLREALQIEIVRLHRELGVTIVYVTHDQEEALAMSDSIAVYRAGEISQLGTAEELYESPSSLYVAEFMGESNVFRGSVSEHRDGRVTVSPYGITGLISTSPDGTGHPPLPGGQVALMVRPERMRVEPDQGQASAPGHNAISGLLTNVMYLGASVKYYVQLSSGEHRHVRSAAATRRDLVVGDRVRLTWRVGDDVLFTDLEEGRDGAHG
ncbi:ABC transporter ATP-binding protein [Actinomadura sp. NPDC048955]|uniref:ABC transporter ATP-binding protein n=1 Tax=Actinomadura sp. NPDC048955 TaxID=3158228 RepID=UPI0033DAD350